MRMRDRWAVAVLAVAAGGACASGGMDTSVERQLNTTLEAQGGWQGRAAARANTLGGQTAVAVTVAGATSGAVHPWHIHTGRCGSNGGVVGAASAYTPITIGANGGGTQQARVSVGLDAGAEYHVNIHQSPQQLGTIIACGNLR